MAAYGALVSLFNTLEQIKQHLVHAHLPISVDREQIESLIEKVSFLIDFLEHFSNGSTEVQPLESTIRDAAHAARDAIESNLAKQLLAKFKIHHHHKERISFSSLFCYKAVKKITNEEETDSSVLREDGVSEVDPLNEALQKAIEEMESIKKKAVEIEEERPNNDNTNVVEPPKQVLLLQSSLRGDVIASNKSIGFDGYLIQIMDRLMGQQSNLLVIPIVGMGGIGKTTLVRNAYDSPSAVEYFDLRAWVTISQKYSVKSVVSTLLYSISKKQGEKKSLEKFIDGMSHRSEDEIGRELYQILFGRRYLIVLDDVWSIEAWDQINRFFPDNGKGSRILMTTRLFDVAAHFGSSCSIEVKLLDEENSWDLLQEKILFSSQVGGGGCLLPPELVEIGKMIAKNCGGLPLSLVVIGGLLAKSERTLKYWKSVAENVNAVVNLQDDGRCLKLLSLSYDHLPVHLKPCFLYMGSFPEDKEINISMLINLWVANGYLKKPSSSGDHKSLEEVGEDCLKELTERNLILVHRSRRSQNVKACTIHDLLRDLCLRQAQEEGFLKYVTTSSSLDFKIREFERGVKKYRKSLLNLEHPRPQRTSMLEFLNRVFGRGLLKKLLHDDENVLPQKVNARCVELSRDQRPILVYPLVSMHWNLHTVIVGEPRSRKFWRKAFVAPSEIWEMTQLRHVQFKWGVILPDPPAGEGECCALENLHTLSRMKNFKCSEEVLKRIPNIKKLEIWYDDDSSMYSLNKLVQLRKLESLTCTFDPNTPPKRSDLLPNIVFPNSLKKLKLAGSNLHWEDSAIIGSLPHLEALHLTGDAFIGEEWSPIEGGFLRLKYLKIFWCDGLKKWSADATHFPSLARLAFIMVTSLEEIPLDIGEISTLQYIHMVGCPDSAIISAKNIAEYQLDCGNEDFQAEVFLQIDDKLDVSSTKNFVVHRF